MISMKIECGECFLSLDGYAGDVDEDEKKSYMYNSNVGQLDGHDGDVDDTTTTMRMMTAADLVSI